MKGITPAALGAAMKGDIDNCIVASTPGGIERQEAEGQRDLVNASVARLPKDINDHRFRGKDAKEVYALAGIEVIGECDDIFLNVKLPAGWKLVPTDYSMWSRLVDEQGRTRASVFFKAAFYNRGAHFGFTSRFRVAEEPEDAYNSEASYQEREKMNRFGRVYDGKKVVFETAGHAPVETISGDRTSWERQSKQERELRAECEAWLIANGYPEYSDPLKYW